MSEDLTTHSHKTEVEYLRRSYTAIDGLWFVKVEEVCGRETAEKLDKQVWEVAGKIQARETRKVLGLHTNYLTTLAECLGLKFAAEGYKARITWPDESCLKIDITRCPWLEILEKSGRMQMAEMVAEKICNTEYQAWAKEFGKQLEFSPINTRCLGAPCCYLSFTEK